MPLCLDLNLDMGTRLGCVPFFHGRGGGWMCRSPGPDFLILFLGKSTLSAYEGTRGSMRSDSSINIDNYAHT